jgi:hypothetical protein
VTNTNHLSSESTEFTRYRRVLGKRARTSRHGRFREYLQQGIGARRYHRVAEISVNPRMRRSSINGTMHIERIHVDR